MGEDWEDLANLINQANSPQKAEEEAAPSTFGKKRKRKVSSTDAVSPKRPKLQRAGRGLAKPTRGGASPGLVRSRGVAANQAKKTKGSDVYDMPDDGKAEDNESTPEPEAEPKKRGRPKGSHQSNKTTRTSTSGQRKTKKSSSHTKGRKENNSSTRKHTPKKANSSQDEENEEGDENREEVAKDKSIQASNPSQDVAEAPPSDQVEPIRRNSSEVRDAGAGEGEPSEAQGEHDLDNAVRSEPSQQNRSSPISAQDRSTNEDAGTSQVPAGPRALLEKRLLGKGQLWKDINDAIKSQPTGAAGTEAVKEIVSATKDATTLYRDIGRHQRGGTSTAELEANVEPYLDDLENKVIDLSRGSNGRHTGRRVADVYRDAVPELRKLLSQTMNVRVLRDSRKSYDLGGIREIVRIQETIILLCNKVASWGVPPTTEVPITRNIKQRVLPYMRLMVERFRTELANAERRERIQQNIIASQQQIERAPSPPSSTEEDRQAAIERQRRDIQASIEEQRRADEKFSRWNRLRRKQRSVTADPSPRPPESRERTWTEEEDLALMVQLLSNKTIIKLPGSSPPTHPLSSPLYAHRSITYTRRSPRAVPGSFESRATAAEYAPGAYPRASVVLEAWDCSVDCRWW